MDTYTTQFLERLSTDELISLAVKHGLDVPAELERIFIINELLYLDTDGIGKSEEEENPALLKQHNVSIIEVLVRDPLWAFVFWEIKDQDKADYEGDTDFEGYFLRVIPLKQDSSQPDIAASFTVAVGKNDSAWYLGFPPDDRRFYQVELCVSRLEESIVLAVSRPFRMPLLIDPKHTGDDGVQSVYQTPLAQLSGVEHFSLLRKMDRPLRSRNHRQ